MKGKSGQIPTTPSATPSIWNRQNVRQAVISALLFIHIIVITCWAAPIDSPLLLAFRDFIRPYMAWSGLFQSWDTFAPSPRSVNDYVEAGIIGRNGQVQSWKFPRMEQLTFFERYGKERYRKFSENLTDKKNLDLWPGVARHLARLYRDPANPPEIVMLIQYWSAIVPGAKDPPSSTPQHAQIFFVYHVQPGDLR